MWKAMIAHDSATKSQPIRDLRQESSCKRTLKKHLATPVKGIVHPKTKICMKLNHPQSIKDLYEFIS